MEIQRENTDKPKNMNFNIIHMCHSVIGERYCCNNSVFYRLPPSIAKKSNVLYNIFSCTLHLAMPHTSQLSTREKLMRQNCSFSNYVMQFDLLGLFYIYTVIKVPMISIHQMLTFTFIF